MITTETRGGRDTAAFTDAWRDGEWLGVYWASARGGYSGHAPSWPRHWIVNAPTERALQAMLADASLAARTRYASSARPDG